MVCLFIKTSFVIENIGVDNLNNFKKFLALEEDCIFKIACYNNNMVISFCPIHNDSDKFNIIINELTFENLTLLMRKLHSNKLKIYGYLLTSYELCVLPIFMEYCELRRYRQTDKFIAYYENAQKEMMMDNTYWYSVYSHQLHQMKMNCVDFIKQLYAMKQEGKVAKASYHEYQKYFNIQVLSTVYNDNTSITDLIISNENKIDVIFHMYKTFMLDA